MTPPERDVEDDRTKCWNEIHQLQGQQFTLTTFALTFFGAFFAFITSRINSLGVDETTAIIPILASVILLIILSILFEWTLHLRKTVLVISTWMELTAKNGKFGWEHDARDLSSSKKRSLSSTIFVAQIYFWLGVASPLLILTLDLPGIPKHFCKYWMVFCIVTALWAAYAANIRIRGIKSRKPRADTVKKWWEEVWTKQAGNSHQEP